MLEWAWSGENPFGSICDQSGEVAVEVFGLAICQYSDNNQIYRFSCDREWETEQDSVYNSVIEAKENIPSQYCEVTANWQVCN